MKINPLDAVSAKNKSKDIHLANIDVNFGSNRILSVSTVRFLDDWMSDVHQQLWRITNACVWPSLRPDWSQWCWKVDIAAAYRYA